MSDKQRQTCKVCGRPDKFDFHVPDAVWEAIVPEEYRNKVVCLNCFDDFAAAKGIKDYQHHIRLLYFAGEQVSMTWVNKEEIDYLLACVDYLYYVTTVDDDAMSSLRDAVWELRKLLRDENG